MKKIVKDFIYKYEPEADILMWEVSSAPIDYAQESGNVVVHFDKKNQPVLIEILEAQKFFQNTQNVLEKQPALASR